MAQQMPRAGKLLFISGSEERHAGAALAVGTHDDFDAAVLLVLEFPVHFRAILKPDEMRDNERGVDVAFFDGI
jgi:hypothetical protein